MVRSMLRDHSERRARALDALCLVLLMLASALPYAGRLGFYSDDWSLIGGFRLAELAGRSPWDGLIAGFAARPLQGLHLASLYALFGLDPLGYHIVNAAVLAACVALFHLLLFRLGVGRRDAFAAALILVVLPQLSTLRAWTGASQVGLAMLLMLTSLHAQLSFARSRKAGWAAMALLAGLASVAAYETFAPLIAGFAIGLAIDHSRRRQGAVRMAAAGVALAIVALALAVLFKLAVSDRAGPIAEPARYVQGLRQLVRTDYDWRLDSSLNLFAALSVHFWMTVTGWAEGAVRLLEGRAGAAAAAVALAAGALALWRARRLPGEDRGLGPGRLVLLGAGAFVLGHAAFLAVPSIVFAPTGMGNRALAAAAPGAALILVSAAALAARAVPDRLREPAFALIVAAIAVAGTARITQILDHWAAAAALQRTILDRARTDLARIPASSTVILDGICPYHGPGVVFETWWDTGPALSLALGRPVEGDVVSPRMRLTQTGIETSIYRQPRLHPYGVGLHVYNPALRTVRTLPDREAALAYFSRRDRRLECPAGYVARGVPV